VPGLAPAGDGAIPYGRIISIYSPKGGVGVTTITANLAVALHGEGTPVAVVDGNLQYGDLSFFFNEQGKNNIVDLAPRVDELDKEVIEEVIIEHSESGIKILAAPKRPQDAEAVTGEEFSKILKFLCQMYSYVLVDSSASLNEITLSSIDASDIIVVLTTQDIPSVKNVRLFLDLIDALGISRDRVMFAMNRYDKRRSITPEKVSENFKQEFAAVVPVEEKLVVPAMDRGVPFMLQTKTHPVSRNIRTLADKIRKQIAHLQEIEAEPVS
jgi:pilus assembly protein CpaE